MAGGGVGGFLTSIISQCVASLVVLLQTVVSGTFCNFVCLRHAHWAWRGAAASLHHGSITSFASLYYQFLPVSFEAYGK